MFLKDLAFCKITTNYHRASEENGTGQNLCRYVNRTVTKPVIGALGNDVGKPGRQHKLSGGCLREY